MITSLQTKMETEKMEKTHSENLLKLLINDIISDYIYDHGMNKIPCLTDFDDEKLFQLAYKICMSNNDFDELLSDDKFHEVPSMLFGMIMNPEDSSIFFDNRSELKKYIFNYYKYSILSLLEESYNDSVFHFHLDEGHTYSIDEQTGEGSWK